MKHKSTIFRFALAFCLVLAFPAQPEERADSRGISPVGSDSMPQSTGRFVVAVVGVDDYKYWPKLDNAVRDALGTARLLTDKFGFVSPVPPLLNEEATKENIETLVADTLRDVLQHDDNLILLFAGHGHTRVASVGEHDVETGYLVPVEAQVGTEQRWSQLIEIDDLLTEIGTLPARHILVLLDSCHSGFALSGIKEKARAGLPRYESSLATKLSRRVVTSARRDEEALDSGPIAGHSLFTGSLVVGLDRSLADLDDSNFITSSEIGLYLQQKVGSYSHSRQTPDFGSFDFDDRGEMVIPISLGNDIDSIQRRAFSALRRGEIDQLRSLLVQIEDQGVSGPKTTYLGYRVDITEYDPERAYEAIRSLDRTDWLAGTIPLSRHDVRELLVRLRFWKVFLGLPEDEFPLEVTFLQSTSREGPFERVESSRIGNSRGYEVGTGDYFQMRINNPTPDTWHVYMMDIDQDGRVNPVPLWDSSTQFDGLAAGRSETTLTFKHDGDAPGMAELRLFASPQRIQRLLFPPSTAARGALAPIDESQAIGVKVRSLVYRAIPRQLLVQP